MKQVDNLKPKYKYTLGEELINAISHGIGATFSIVALVLLILKAIEINNSKALISALIYGISLIILYLMSTMYHSLSPKLKAKQVFRILDHCSIFLLILGTYAPILIYAMGNTSGIIKFIIMFAVSVLGIILNSINIEKFKKVSFALYLILGWIAIFSLPAFLKTLTKPALIYIAIGGLFYTLGAFIYLLGKKMKYMHCVWHFFVLLGSIFHFIAIYFYVLV